MQGNFKTLSESNSAALNPRSIVFRARSKIPTCTSHLHVQRGRRRLFNGHPRFAEAFCCQIKSIWQKARIAQEHDMRLHAWDILTVDGSSNCSLPATASEDIDRSHWPNGRYSIGAYPRTRWVPSNIVNFVVG